MKVFTFVLHHLGPGVHRRSHLRWVAPSSRVKFPVLRARRPDATTSTMRFEGVPGGANATPLLVPF